MASVDARETTAASCDLGQKMRARQTIDLGNVRILRNGYVERADVDRRVRAYGEFIGTVGQCFLCVHRAPMSLRTPDAGDDRQKNSDKENSSHDVLDTH